MNDQENYVNTSFTMKEAIAEAQRCLNCKKPMCRTGCPIENEIPDFIHQLSKGNLGEARKILADHRRILRPSRGVRTCLPS